MKTKGNIEHYVIRFKENNEIKTINAYDEDTFKYIKNSLDFNDKAYVIVKETRFVDDFTIKSLLDYKESD